LAGRTNLVVLCPHCTIATRRKSCLSSAVEVADCTCFRVPQGLINDGAHLHVYDPEVKESQLLKDLTDAKVRPSLHP
jgi:hypothetical protein